MPPELELVDVPEDPPDDEDVEEPEVDEPDEVDEDPDVDEPDDVDDDPEVDEPDDVDDPPLLLVLLVLPVPPLLLLLPPELVLEDDEPFGAGAFSKPVELPEPDGAGSVGSSVCVGSGAVAHATAKPASTTPMKTLAARAFVVVVIAGLLVQFSAQTARGRAWDTPEGGMIKRCRRRGASNLRVSTKSRSRCGSLEGRSHRRHERRRSNATITDAGPTSRLRTTARRITVARCGCRSTARVVPRSTRLVNVTGHWTRI